jgi:hypothetical protein
MFRMRFVLMKEEMLVHQISLHTHMGDPVLGQDASPLRRIGCPSRHMRQWRRTGYHRDRRSHDGVKRARPWQSKTVVVASLS